MQQNFSISNTDVVTMLMVKQTKILEQKRIECIITTGKILAEINERVIKSFNKKLASVQHILDAYKDLILLINSNKVPITLDLCEPEIYHNSIYRNGEKEFFEANLVHLNFTVKFDEDKYGDRYLCIEPANGFFIPFKFSFKEEVSKEYKDLKDEIYRIDQLLRNKEALKEAIIAKTTENAIANMPELKTLTANIEDFDLINS